MLRPKILAKLCGESTPTSLILISAIQPYKRPMSHGNSGPASPAHIYNADTCPVCYLANMDNS